MLWPKTHASYVCTYNETKSWSLKLTSVTLLGKSNAKKLALFYVHYDALCTKTF